MSTKWAQFLYLPLQGGGAACHPVSCATAQILREI